MDGDRRGDWEKGVDENLAMLNSAQRSTDKELDDLDLLTQKHERILLGDAEEKKIGISAQIDQQDILVNELRAELRSIKSTIYGDHTGHAGLETKVEKLEDKRRWSEKREGWAWDSFTKIAVELLLVIAMLLLNWERIEDFFKARFGHPEQAPAAQTHKARRKRKPKPIVLPELGADSSADSVP